MIHNLISRYKQRRTERYLRQMYQCSYAFVGMGQHSLTNLYPVVRHLGLPLKYVVVTSERRARLIERKFVGLKATASLDEVLADDEVKGVFVSASPSAHFSLASRVLQSKKCLFIEKPPCQSLAELDRLIALQRLYGVPVAMAGLQKRYAPAVQLLKRRLSRERLISYDFRYLTGSYPEGQALFDLYIHSIDLVCHLFGRPEVMACHQSANDSWLLMLRHPHVVGTLELSTAYSWAAAEESLKVCTQSGVYQLSPIDSLTFTPRPATPFGIPLEKLHPCRCSREYLCRPDHFNPILAANPVYTQGYFREIQSFAEAVEGRGSHVLTDLQSLRPTYETLEHIKP